MGYPTKKELNIIRQWDVEDDPIGLVYYVAGLWHWPDFFKYNWYKENLTKRYLLHVEAHTGGWSGNEDLIEAFNSHWLFSSLFLYQWQRGGHFWYKVSPYVAGYREPKRLAEHLGVSKQAISKSLHNYDVVRISERRILVRQKRRNND